MTRPAAVLLVCGAAAGTAGAPTPAPGGADVAALEEKVARATRILAREGVIGSSGHVSARVPGTSRVVIGPADVSREVLTAADTVIVDLEAKRVEGGRPPLETEIHTGIYRARPDVMAVVHSHPLHSVVFSITGKPILPVSVHGAIFVAALQLEENAEKQLLAEATGRVEPMTAEEAARCVKQSFGPFSIAKRWEYYAQRERRRP